MSSISGPSSSPPNPYSAGQQPLSPLDQSTIAPQKIYEELENILLDLQLAQKKKPEEQQKVIDQVAQFLHANSPASSPLQIFIQNGWISSNSLKEATEAYKNAIDQLSNTEDATPNILDKLRDNLQIFQSCLNK